MASISNAKNYHPVIRPAGALRAALDEAARELAANFKSIWLIEHSTLPDGSRADDTHSDTASLETFCQLGGTEYARDAAMHWFDDKNASLLFVMVRSESNQFSVNVSARSGEVVSAAFAIIAEALNLDEIGTEKGSRASSASPRRHRVALPRAASATDATPAVKLATVTPDNVREAHVTGRYGLIVAIVTVVGAVIAALIAKWA